MDKAGREGEYLDPIDSQVATNVAKFASWGA